MPEAPPRALPGQLAQRVLLDASNDGEALVSGVRIVFLGLVLARYLALGGVHAEGGVPAAWVELPVLGIGILLSVASVGAARRRWFDERLLVASTLLDAVLAHASLLSTLAWHGPQYTGLLRMPDPAAAIAVVFVSALRLCPRAAWVGTVTNLMLMGGLVALDFRLNAAFITYGLSELVLLFLFIASVGAVASLVCHTARRMVLTMAGTRERVQRTRRHLDLLLREHHDARTLLSSARLRADLLMRQPEGRATERHARAIAEDLGALSAFVSRVKSRAMGELAMSGDASAVDVGTTLHQAAEQVQLRFTHVHIVVEGPLARVSRAHVVGGAPGLAHVVTNLLVNACEGDGQLGARTVHVSVEAEGGRRSQVLLRVTDDGPGFRAGLLEGTRPRGGTTKRDGSGLGLLLVKGLVEASGGSLRASSPPGGGARVEVLLPAGA